MDYFWIIARLSVLPLAVAGGALLYKATTIQPVSGDDRVGMFMLDLTESRRGCNWLGGLVITLALLLGWLSWVMD